MCLLLFKPLFNIVQLYVGKTISTFDIITLRFNVGINTIIIMFILVYNFHNKKTVNNRINNIINVKMHALIVYLKKYTKHKRIKTLKQKFT